MFGFIKYKLLKWLLNDICNMGECTNCMLGSKGNPEIDCGDVYEHVYAQARKVWLE